ncbi:hypothetical protein CYMTET_47657 [Cymbomonas tetramitiformis]|uniref:Uncharacterized protein n=1 Tax=Cymbomonas tetramitiformis TaxID=36881 RepID=A0AAE0EVY1_9CHLO|nr:hypothetical protein CYMTET_47657 [Cymbomonas tetramitiformis]
MLRVNVSCKYTIEVEEDGGQPLSDDEGLLTYGSDDHSSSYGGGSGDEVEDEEEGETQEVTFEEVEDSSTECDGTAAPSVAEDMEAGEETDPEGYPLQQHTHTVSEYTEVWRSGDRGDENSGGENSDPDTVSTDADEPSEESAQPSGGGGDSLSGETQDESIDGQALLPYGVNPEEHAAAAAAAAAAEDGIGFDGSRSTNLGSEGEGENSGRNYYRETYTEEDTWTFVCDSQQQEHEEHRWTSRFQTEEVVRDRGGRRHHRRRSQQQPGRVTQELVVPGQLPLAIRDRLPEGAAEAVAAAVGERVREGAAAAASSAAHSASQRRSMRHANRPRPRTFRTERRVLQPRRIAREMLQAMMQPVLAEEDEGSGIEDDERSGPNLHFRRPNYASAYGEQPREGQEDVNAVPSPTISPVAPRAPQPRHAFPNNIFHMPNSNLQTTNSEFPSKRPRPPQQPAERISTPEPASEDSTCLLARPANSVPSYIPCVPRPAEEEATPCDENAVAKGASQQRDTAVDAMDTTGSSPVEALCVEDPEKTSVELQEAQEAGQDRLEGLSEPQLEESTAFGTELELLPAASVEREPTPVAQPESHALVVELPEETTEPLPSPAVRGPTPGPDGLALDPDNAPSEASPVRVTYDLESTPLEEQPSTSATSGIPAGDEPPKEMLNRTLTRSKVLTSRGKEVATTTTPKNTGRHLRAMDRAKRQQDLDLVGGPGMLARKGVVLGSTVRSRQASSLKPSTSGGTSSDLEGPTLSLQSIGHASGLRLQPQIRSASGTATVTATVAPGSPVAIRARTWKRGERLVSGARTGGGGCRAEDGGRANRHTGRDLANTGRLTHMREVGHMHLKEEERDAEERGISPREILLGERFLG